MFLILISLHAYIIKSILPNWSELFGSNDNITFIFLSPTLIIFCMSKWIVLSYRQWKLLEDFQIWMWYFLCDTLCVCVHAQLCPTLCNRMDYIARQAPLSMEFSGQEYCSGLPFPSPGYFLYPEIKLTLSCIFCISKRVLYQLGHWGSNCDTFSSGQFSRSVVTDSLGSIIS